MADAATDLTQLTEEQQLALQQFTSVTDQDLAAAVPLLRKCQWNAQIAITRFFDGDADTVDPAAEAARAPPPRPQDTRRAETLMDSIPARPSGRSSRREAGLEPAPRVVPTPENQVSQPVPFPFSLLLLPFNLASAVFHRILGTVAYVFPFLPRLLSRLPSFGPQPSSSSSQRRRPLSNTTDTAARFAREFEEEYGAGRGTLPFHEGGYAHAFDAAKRELRFLLVVLLSPEHDDTAGFARDTLLAPQLVEFVRRPANNILLWAGSVQDAEPYQVAAALGATRFPYVCLVVHTPSVSATAMSKVVASSGPVGAGELVAKLQGAMEARAEELERVRRQREEQAASRTLREEQESAYERSLAQDREKTRRRREEAAAREKAEREEREREERAADEARKLALWRRWRAQSIRPEPGPEEEKSAVRMSLRMPSGERVVRRFPPDAELEELYAFVECHGLLLLQQDVEEKEVGEPRDYEHAYGFRLVSPMPREVYDLATGGKVRERIGRSGNLIVERIEDEEDEEDEDEGS